MFQKIVLTLALVFTGSSFATSLQDFSALHGCWRGTVNGGVLQESWSKDSGGIIFGTDQMLDANGHNLGWGFMTLSAAGQDIQFTYSDGGKAAQPFKLANYTGSGGDSSATFTRDENADVSKVVFTLTNNKSVRIQLFGKGAENGLDFVIDRVSDNAECP